MIIQKSKEKNEGRMKKTKNKERKGREKESEGVDWGKTLLK